MAKLEERLKNSEKRGRGHLLSFNKAKGSLAEAEAANEVKIHKVNLHPSIKSLKSIITDA